ncbi:MAG TPA: amino acid adenylation domain-containing protein [Pilimelia sp.]|nr:amino acid adenylation domain-containing protein [Pilimelia sp.]
MLATRVPADWQVGPRLYYPDRRLPDLVADHARRRPDAIAVRQWDDTLTYAELVARAATLAATLRERGAGPEVLVGVCARRTPPMVAGLLGVMLTGAGYVPLDPALPPGRLRDIAAEAGLRMVVCDAAGAELLTGSGLVLVPIPAIPASGPVFDDACPAGPAGVAYVMFTSGSTGRPKGVAIPHQGLTEFVTSLGAMAGLDAGCVSLGFASIGFDASVIDLLTPLALGGAVALVGAADRGDPVRLQRFCEAHRVTAAFVPPAVLPLLHPERLPDLRVLMTGSEAPGPEQVARWSGAGRRFLNLYGPTEATVLVTWFEATGSWDRPLPIGRPAPNHRVYVVDAGLRPVGVGEPGELLAGGAGLARGYLGDPSLTAERFVPDPFSGESGARLYRTGDLVSWQPDGTLQFIGRADRQVKVRGQRVEIGEVEAALRSHPGVGHAAVAAVPGPDGGRELLAFVTPGGEAAPGDVAAPSAAELREHCARRLPAAAVPGRVLTVAELPLLSSGKVNVDRLVAQARRTAEIAAPAGPPVDPPATAAEEHIAAVWADLLGTRHVGRDDDFFDAGGHSITAMRLVSGVRSRLRRDLSIEDVLAGRTLRAIAARAEAATPLGDEPPVRGRPPALSPSQQRLWFLERYSPEAAAAYNVALAERLRGPLDLPALRAALDAVAVRQQVLRWRVPDADGIPYAVADPPAPAPLPVEDLSALPPDQRERELSDRLAARVAERFELATGPLWHARLYRLDADDHVLAITAHHAVFDGWSQAPLYEDLATAYAAARAGRPATLPALPATYGDYVAFREHRRTERAEADLAWWTSHLEGVPTILELPADRPRPAEQTFTGAYAGRWLDAGTTAAAARLARDAGATPSAVLLAALGVVVARLTGQPDMVIGSPMVDRRDADFEEMVGFFIEIAPLRLRPDATASFAAHVRQARDELLAALAHPEAPLERIVRELGLGGQVARSPLVQVLFNMFNFAEPRLDLAGLACDPVLVRVPGSPFDLTVYGVERDGRLRIDAVYNPDLYDAARMQALLESLRQVIAAGTMAPDVPVRDLPLPAVDPPPVPPADVPRARSRPAVGASTVVTEPPATPTERAIAEVWCDVLGRTAVGATDSFFDSGGGSLAIVVVQQRLNRLLGCDLRVVDLFRYPTVRALAAHLDGGGTDHTDAALDRAARRGAARRDRGRRRAPSRLNEGLTEEGTR